MSYILIEDILLISQQGLDRLTIINTSNDLLFLMEELVDKIGYDKLAATYEQYNQRENIDRILTSTAELLWQEFTKYDNWTDALKGFTGKDTIPMMTIHKSKGLEYDVVFFIGLEDGAFLSDDSEPYEETCTFFVAVSRAKERIDFTFSSKRGLARFNYYQTHHIIDILHKTLKQSEIVKVSHHNESDITTLPLLE